MAKEATARRRKPEKKVDFIKRNFETMTYREMSEHIGLSPRGFTRSRTTS